MRLVVFAKCITKQDQCQATERTNLRRNTFVLMPNYRPIQR